MQYQTQSKVNKIEMISEMGRRATTKMQNKWMILRMRLR